MDIEAIIARLERAQTDIEAVIDDLRDAVADQNLEDVNEAYARQAVSLITQSIDEINEARA